MSDNTTDAIKQAQQAFQAAGGKAPTQSNSNVQTPVNNPNPANAPEDFDESQWVPMSAPVARLQIPEKPGYHRHWFRNEPGRIERAQRAGYRFVDASEVSVVNRSLGGAPEEGGNTDLGSRVSVAAGGIADNGQAMRLYLMECPQHLYKKNLAMLQADTDNTVTALSAGRGGKDDNPAEGGKTYIRGDLPSLFKKKG